MCAMFIVDGLSTFCHVYGNSATATYFGYGKIVDIEFLGAEIA